MSAPFRQDARYGRWLIAIHWITLLLLAGVYACIELRGNFPRGSAMRIGLKEWHYALGLAVFAVVWVRLALRLTGRTPPVTPPLAAWQASLSALVHAALYVFMAAMPVLGWLLLSAEGETPAWLPALMGADEALAPVLEEWHETLGTAGYWLVGLHAAAALVHHYVLRDDTLLRMAPRRHARVR